MIDAIAILKRAGGSLPRYTSYPTAPHFSAGLGAEMSREMIAGLRGDEPVSIYLHIPFCDRLCWFCGCHTKQTRRYEPVERYVNHLCREIGLFAEKAALRPHAAQIHFGGGSPSMLRSQDAARIRAALDAAFVIGGETEISVEIDPSDMTEDAMAALGKLGMTRASIGVQDFDPRVQAAINRPQTFADTAEVIARLRDAGVASINIDALYGLPLQTAASLGRTINQVISLAPDRVALFGYAHVPWVKKHQKMIAEDALPSMEERFRQARLAAYWLEEAGYHPIGIDHFARPGDALAVAARKGALRRNFQGYTTDGCETLIGFGASAIGRFGGGYVQNIVATGQYEDSVSRGELPAAKGFRLSQDDRIRGHIIERLMCDFRVEFDDLEQRFGAAARPYIALARQIIALDREGLCEPTQRRITLRPEARPLVRLVASKFDAYLAQGNFRYSKAV